MRPADARAQVGGKKSQISEGHMTVLRVKGFALAQARPFGVTRPCRHAVWFVCSL